MSAPDQNGQIEQQRSRVKISTTAKHEPTWEISVVEGADEDEIQRLVDIATRQHKALHAEFYGGAPCV